MFHAARRIVSPIIYLLLAGLFLGSPSIRLAQAKAAMPGVNRARTSSSGLSVPDTLAHAFYSDTSTTALAALGCLQTSTYNAGYHPRSLAVGDLDRDANLTWLSRTGTAILWGYCAEMAMAGSYCPRNTVL